MLTGNKFSSKQAQLLYNALLNKGINAQLEYSDGHKTVDIAILNARLFIEVDGIQHFIIPDQIMRDFNRSHYSDKNNYSTFYVTNQIIDSHLDDVVNALVEVILRRINKYKVGIEP